MRKLIFGLLAAAAAVSASAASAAVEIDFNNPTGNLGSSHTYSNGGLSVTANGVTFGLAPTDLYGKNASAADEKGVGIANDPTGDHEIWTGAESGTAIILDVSDLLANNVSEAQFFMGSTTDGESWVVWGEIAPGSFVALLSGSDELTWHDLPGWGWYSDYAFTAGNVGNNVLLGGLSLTQSVPEPATWAMMLLGFGAVGVAFRRRRRGGEVLAQIA